MVEIVKKRDGSTEPFEPNKINVCAEHACKGLENVSASEVILDAHLKLYDGVSTKEIDEALIVSARAKIEKEPNYSYVAARLMLFTIYKEVFGESKREDFTRQHNKFFAKNLRKLVEAELVDPELLNFDLEKIKDALDHKRDHLLKYLGVQTLYDRYLLKIGKRRMETPQGFFMRVAMGLAINEENREEKAIEFYNMLSTFRMLSSTPTLFNSGTMRSQLSSCFLNTFDDSIDGIFDGLWQEARKSKFAGGLGFDLTPLRCRGSYIKGTNGENQGAVFFWKLFNDLLVAVNQGGKRRGAGCAYLETWHGDLEDFLSLRKNTGDERTRTHDMNTANWIPDLFIKQVLKDGEWYLFSPSEAPELHETFGEEFERHYWNYVEKGKRGELRVFEERKAKDLWKKMLRALFETGHPWITFKDPSNIRYANQHEGVVHSSNLCTEILEHTKPSVYKDGKKVEIGETAVCNLASINLAAHVVDAEIQWDMLAESIQIATRMLDNVIDINFYPTEEAKNSNLKHRFVGLGSMGWQDMFYKLGISYGSDEAVAMADKVYEFISYHAILGSSKLAKERGKYPTYEGSLWSKNIFPIDTYRSLMEARGENARIIGKAEESMDWSEVRDHVKKHGMRNALTMAIAPTATISFIAGCSQSTEPDFGVLYVYSTLSGEFTVINEHFVNDMKTLGLWDHDMVDLIKYVDGDLSKLPDDVIPPQVKDKYITAFQMDQEKLLECAAARQKWIDQGASLNLYNNQTSLKFLHETYLTAWKLGLKTTYYLRNSSASKIEKSTVEASEVQRIIAEKQTMAAAVAANKGENGTRIDINDIECVGCQ